MCGIFGAIRLKGFFDEHDYKEFVSCTDLVHYRGPDASGYLAVNIKDKSINNENRFDVFLGHRRLSIIDLSESSNQPLTDNNGLWIIFNGEIFNYIELKNELQQEGYVFKTNSDTEVLLQVYRRYGEAGFAKLNGMWAFVIADIPNNRIVLSRDRFSIKPLYYINTGDSLYFASEIKQLIPFLRSKDINSGVMFKYLDQGIIDYNEETFFKGVYKLKPKHNLIVDMNSGGIKEHNYWNYSINAENTTLSFDDMIEKFRELFIDSVKIRLRSDVKVGALLSGGLDSSSISVIANNFQGGKFFTYSVISEDKKYSEEKFIDVLIRERRINNKKILFKFDDINSFSSYLDTVIYHNDEPFGSLSIIAQFMALESLKKNSDIIVVLSGQGGDETLMGYLKYFFFNIKNLINKGSYIQALNQVIASVIRRTVIWQFKQSEARRYIPFLSRKTQKNFIRIEGNPEPVWEASNLIERQISDIDKYSVPSLTHYEDRNSMAHSLEIRLPFLDYRLVNYVLNLPIALKLNGGWTKYILRKGIHELPDDIRWRRDKQGFIIPEEVWLKKDFSGLINEIFTNSILNEMGIIDSKSFLKYYRSFQEGKRSIWYTDISRALIAELWTRKIF